MDIKCKIKVQSGSVGGRAEYSWIDAVVIKKNDDSHYVVRSLDHYMLFYLKPEEIFINISSIKNWFTEVF